MLDPSWQLSSVHCAILTPLKIARCPRFLCRPVPTGLCQVLYVLRCWMWPNVAIEICTGYNYCVPAMKEWSQALVSGHCMINQPVLGSLTIVLVRVMRYTIRKSFISTGNWCLSAPVWLELSVGESQANTIVTLKTRNNAVSNMHSQPLSHPFSHFRTPFTVCMYFCDTCCISYAQWGESHCHANIMLWRCLAPNVKFTAVTACM